MGFDGETDKALNHARNLALSGDDEAAKQAYVDVLRSDPTCFDALNDLGALNYASGHRSAARTAYRQAAQCHPENAIGRVNLANILADDGELAAAEAHYRAALAADPDFPEAHQGLARIFAELGDERAERHLKKGFAERALIQKRYRGVKPGVPVVMLATARLGNMPTQQWLDDRIFAVAVIHVEFWDAARPLPPHALVVNAIGDADLCGEALMRAEDILARCAAPVINPPALVRATGRADNARRLAALEGVIAPKITVRARAAIAADHDRFPLLLRSPGFHAGRHFRYVENRASLRQAIEALPGDELMAIEYLDARGPDGMARKYRVMFIDGEIFPLHLAISTDWKVHYFTAAMATEAAYRDEERCFLEDMAGALGERAMTALHRICAEIGLDYAGVDFALSRDGSLLLFEANATMVIIPPPPEPIWDYRRGPVAKALEAAKRMACSRAGFSADQCCGAIAQGVLEAPL